MVEKADYQKHFPWSCILKPPLLLIVSSFIPFALLFFFRNSHGLIFSALITITVLFISSIVLFLKLPKNKTKVCLAEGSVQEEEEAEMTDLPSDMDSSSGTVVSEAFDLDWLGSNRMVCNVSSCFDDDYHDGDDDDDDDGLIEIALVNDQHNQQKLWDDNGEEEINEEENLIEIDISIGSIKRSTVEI